MEITLEMVDLVRERTGATYEEAKNALEQANGNVVDAIIAIEKENDVTIDVNEKINELVEKVKALVNEGNVSRILVRHGDVEMINIPVNAGILGGAAGLVLAPGGLFAAILAGLVAKYGFNYRFEIVRQDGAVECVEDVTAEDAQEAAETETKDGPESNS